MSKPNETMLHPEIEALDRDDLLKLQNRKLAALGERLSASPEWVEHFRQAGLKPADLADRQALRELPEADRPAEVYGVEVWRDLNWLIDSEKVLLDMNDRPNLVRALISIFDSQITGGKRYDLALEGRLRGNATFFNSHAVDESKMASYAMDLKPLVDDPSLEIAEFVDEFVQRFRDDVRSRVERLLS